MIDLMKVTLTHEAAAAHWGRADVTFQGDVACIHLIEGDALLHVQQAARKLELQGVTQVALTGALWTLDLQWAFAQGFATAMTTPVIHWTGDDATQALLTSRLESATFARHQKILRGWIPCAQPMRVHLRIIQSFLSSSSFIIPVAVALLSPWASVTDLRPPHSTRYSLR